MNKSTKTTHEKLHIVIPEYNEGNNILLIEREIRKNAEKQGIPVYIHFVNDCSTEEITLRALQKVSKKRHVKVHHTTKTNKGQHNAIKLGMEHIKNGLVGVLDCDMQDPVSELFNMYTVLEKRKNCNAVIGVRSSDGRKGADNKFKIATARIYYKIISVILKKKVYNSSDFYIVRLTESNLKYISTDNMRQSIQDHFNYTTHIYKRKRRNFGKSKYTLCKQLKVAIRGIKYGIRERRKYE